MGWTTYDTQHADLIGQITAAPAAAAAAIEARARKAKAPGDRLRLLGMATIAHFRAGDTSRAEDLIAEADAIPRFLAKATAFADHAVYAAEVEASQGHALRGLQRLNDALQGLDRLSDDVRTAAARAKVRRRSILRANLLIVRGLIYLNCFANPKASLADAWAALKVLPGRHRLRGGTVDLIRRSRKAAVALVDLSLAAGAPPSVHATSLLDSAEEFGPVEGVEAIHLARSRAFLVARRGQMETAELLFGEALFHAIGAGARTEYEQTLEMLAQVSGRRAAQVRAHWAKTWEARHG